MVFCSQQTCIAYNSSYSYPPSVSVQVGVANVMYFQRFFILFTNMHISLSNGFPQETMQSKSDHYESWFSSRFWSLHFRVFFSSSHKGTGGKLEFMKHILSLKIWIFTFCQPDHTKFAHRYWDTISDHDARASGLLSIRDAIRTWCRVNCAWWVTDTLWLLGRL